MNLNPEDGHVMGYATGWTEDIFIGTYADALKKDYLNRMIWRHPVNYIALVRHQDGVVDAVKVFRFKEKSRPLLFRFQDMNPGRVVATEGGPLQEIVGPDAENMEDDPLFSVGGDIGINWNNHNNGHRLVMTGGILAPADRGADLTRGLGNDFACNTRTGGSHGRLWAHEISNQVRTQSTLSPSYWQGSDKGSSLRGTGPVYGQYSIYVSEEADNFPGPGYRLGLNVDVFPLNLLPN